MLLSDTEIIDTIKEII